MGTGLGYRCRERKDSSRCQKKSIILPEETDKRAEKNNEEDNDGDGDDRSNYLAISSISAPLYILFYLILISL